MRRLLSALGQPGRRPGGPRLSVVIPVHDVEPYLAECLDTLLAQSFTDFEAILIDDGSTDRSGEIAERYAGRDGRFRLIRQANAGLGATRNRGAQEAQGDYLAFLDSDDTLPPDAYAAMIDTIERTGSDMVVGTLQRGTSRRHAMRLMRENHQVRRERVTLNEMPLMLGDVFATNKVYRRSFWEDAGLEFPVGMRYEDQPTLTRAFVRARTFDVIRDVVYTWRVRHDDSSITQRRHELSDLRDRVASKRMSTELVMEAGLPATFGPWFRDILPVDMWEYFRSVPGCTEEYWSTLRSAVAEFWSEETVPFEHTRIPVQQRLMGWLVQRGRRDELERLIRYIDQHRGRIPLEERGDKVVARLPGIDDPTAGVPESVFVLADHERPDLVARGCPDPAP